MCVWNSRDGESTTHCCPQGPGTSLAFTCIKSECPTQARMGGGGCKNIDFLSGQQISCRGSSMHTECQNIFIVEVVSLILLDKLRNETSTITVALIAQIELKLTDSANSF